MWFIGTTELDSFVQLVVAMLSQSDLSRPGGSERSGGRVVLPSLSELLRRGLTLVEIPESL